jgi:hypothetical protein
LRDRQKKLFSLLVLKCSCSSVLSMMVAAVRIGEVQPPKEIRGREPVRGQHRRAVTVLDLDGDRDGVGAGNGLKVTLAGTVPNLMVALTGGLH